jgi:RNA:NAD 2'-phosphotransferase (TPT1/KptA family)
MPVAPPWPEYSKTYREVAAEGMEDAGKSKQTWQLRENRGRTSGRRYRESYDRTSGGNTYYDLHMEEKPTVVRGRPHNNEMTRFNNDVGKALQQMSEGKDIDLHVTPEGKDVEVQATMSKKLSAILRHNNENLQVYKDGSFELSALLNILRKDQKDFLMTDDNLLYLVQSSDKQRFQLTYATYQENDSNYKVYIRAVQGHSGKVAKMIDSCKAMEKITVENCPVYCVHATVPSNFTSIRTSGMVPGGPKDGKDSREHVHFATQFTPEKRCDSSRSESQL